MRTAFWCLVFTVALSAQEAPQIDPDLMAAWKKNVELADQLYSDKAKALQASDVYKEFRAAEAQRDKVKTAIQSAVAIKAPGYTLDLKTWTFSGSTATN